MAHGWKGLSGIGRALRGRVMFWIVLLALSAAPLPAGAQGTPSPSGSAPAAPSPSQSPTLAPSPSPSVASPTPIFSPSASSAPLLPAERIGAAVRLGGEVAFRISHSVGDLSPEQRAVVINRRLREILADPKAGPAGFEVKVDPSTGLPYVRHVRFNRVLFTVYPQDAGQLTPLSLASDWADGLEAALAAVRERQRKQAAAAAATARRQQTARGFAVSAIALVVFVAAIFGVRLMVNHLQRWVRTTKRMKGRMVYHGVELLSHARVRAGLVGLLQWIRFLAYAGLATALVQRVLNSFPATRSQANVIVAAVEHALNRLGTGVVAAIPGLVNIVIIVVAARLALRAFRAFTDLVQSGQLSLEPYVPREVVQPTRAVGRLLIILIALFFIGPNIPGSGTDVAKVITVFIGIIVSFSSTTTIGNFLAGLVIAYTRPFQRGDRVKVGDAVGDVVDYTLLYTRLRTPKNEEILLPSHQVLNSPITNYSSVREGLILHTTVTIGYGTPRTTVERLLLEAAGRTPRVVEKPAPFVLIRSLDDFYVTYEINVYTREPSAQLNIYSDLHENIKDAFDAAGVEIMSPHYRALRSGRESTVVAEAAE